MELRGKNIIVVSNEGWGDVWYSKHNYAYELSRTNDVIFLDPPDRWRLSNATGSKISITQILKGLRVLRYTNVLPSVTDLTYRLNNTLVSRAILRRLQQERWPVDLFISFDPSRIFDPRLLGADGSLFIAVDDYDLSLRGERRLYSNVDRIATISEGFNATYAPFKKPMLTISHGISSEEFIAPPSGIGFDQFGLYIGTLDARIELATVEEMVMRFPEVPFVFIGDFRLHGVRKAEELFLRNTYSNLHYLGVKPFKELKSYVAEAGFCLAPMDIAKHGNAISHHKVFQYLAFGKPIFSTVFREYAPIAHLMYMRNDREILLGDLERFLKNSEPGELKKERIAFARKHTYESIFEQLGSFLGSK